MHELRDEDVVAFLQYRPHRDRQPPNQGRGHKQVLPAPLPLPPAHPHSHWWIPHSYRREMSSLELEGQQLCPPLRDPSWRIFFHSWSPRALVQKGHRLPHRVCLLVSRAYNDDAQFCGTSFCWLNAECVWMNAECVWLNAECVWLNAECVWMNAGQGGLYRKRRQGMG